MHTGSVSHVPQRNWYILKKCHKDVDLNIHACVTKWVLIWMWWTTASNAKALSMYCHQLSIMTHYIYTNLYRLCTTTPKADQAALRDVTITRTSTVRSTVRTISQWLSCVIKNNAYAGIYNSGTKTAHAYFYPVHTETFALESTNF